MTATTQPPARRDPARAPAVRRSARALARILTIIVAVTLVPLTYGALTSLFRADPQSAFFYLIFLLLPASLGLVGSLLTSRRPENTIGWLLLVAGALSGVAFACGEYERAALAAGQTDSAVFVPAAWIASTAFIPSIGILVVFLPLLYPTGRLPSPRWRIVVALGIFGASMGAIGPAVAPGPLGDPRGPANPFAAPEPLLTIIGTAATVGNLMAPPVFLAALGALLLRFRRSTGVERQQIKWFLFVATLAAVALGVSIVGPPATSDVSFAVGILTMGLLPLAIGVAILRYRLYEIDRIVNRALVYGAVTAILAGVFAAVTALSQRMFIAVAGQSSDTAVVLTTLVVVAVYAPVRKRVEAVVDRYFKYDQREYGPYLDELRRYLDLVDPARAAARLAKEAMRHTGATGVAVVGPGDDVLATAGAWPPASHVTIEIALGGPLTAILLGPRRDGKPHPPARLEALAEAAAVAVQAVTATAPNPPVGPVSRRPSPAAAPLRHSP